MRDFPVDPIFVLVHPVFRPTTGDIRGQVKLGQSSSISSFINANHYYMMCLSGLDQFPDYLNCFYFTNIYLCSHACVFGSGRKLRENGDICIY